MKIDTKSLFFGIILGIIIGSIVMFALVKPLPSGLEAEKYTVTIKFDTQLSTYRTQDLIKYGVTAIFFSDNTIPRDYQIGYWNPVIITLQKGAYILKIYDGKSGVYIEEFNIYLDKDIEIELSL